MSAKNLEDAAFRRASAKVKATLTIEALTTMWNAAKLGKRPAGVKTVKRWLDMGATTKNPRFDVWLVGVASFCK